MLSAEFFDIFGLIIFVIILIIGCFMLEKAKKKKFRLIGWALLIIGVLGIVVDGIIVFNTYIIG